MNARTHKNPMYRIWQNMKNRCERPNLPAFARYGALGITVDLRWRDFDAFCADMGPRPEGGTLERIDNDGPYSPENCRWATVKEQANNRRANHMVTINGVTQTVAEAARAHGMAYQALLYRLQSGMSAAEAVARPMRYKWKPGAPITHAGRTMTLGEWSAETGIRKTTIHMRIYKYGWPVDRALLTPPS